MNSSIEDACLSDRSGEVLLKSKQCSDSKSFTITSETTSPDNSSSSLASSVGSRESEDDFELSKASSKTRQGSKIDETISHEHDIQSQQFISGKIDVLKKKCLRDSTHFRQKDTSFQNEQFSAKKIQLLHNKVTYKTIQPEAQYKPKDPDLKKLKNTRKLEELNIKNVMFDVQKKIDCQIHQPRKCRKCRRVQGLLNKEEYTKRKVSQLRQHKINYDIEMHLYQRDSVTLIADIINSGPKLTDSPEEIWNRLLRRGKYKI